MARILLNSRASRVTIVDNITLQPAAVVEAEGVGKVVKATRTLISERRSGPKNPSPYERVMGCRATQRLFAAGVLAWLEGPEGHVDEPGAPEAATEKLQGDKQPGPAPHEGSDGTSKAKAGAEPEGGKAAAEGEAKRPEGTTKKAESDTPAKPSSGSSKASRGG
jgi:hypothetical protein